MDEREEGQHTVFHEEPICGSASICSGAVTSGSMAGGASFPILPILFGAMIGFGIGGGFSGGSGFSGGGGSFGGGGASGGH